MTSPAIPDTLTTTVKTAAALLGVGEWTLYAAIRDGTAPLPVIRVRNRISVPTAALRRLLEGRPEGEG